MAVANPPIVALTDDVVAELTAAAYRVALRHGTRGPFIDLELDLWRAMRTALTGVVAEKAEAAPCPR